MTAARHAFTPTEVKDRIDEMLNERNDFVTPLDGRSFLAHRREVDIIITNAQGMRRTIRHQDAVAFIRRYLALAAPKVSDFQMDGPLSNHLYVIVQAAIETMPK